MIHLPKILQAFLFQRNSSLPSSIVSDVSETTSITYDEYDRDDDVSIATTYSATMKQQQQEEGAFLTNEYEEYDYPKSPNHSPVGMLMASSSSTRIATVQQQQGHTFMSKSVPIACPTPSRDLVQEKEFEQDLMYMYNEATWRMYHRIVDARATTACSKDGTMTHSKKKSSPSTSSSHTAMNLNKRTTVSWNVNENTHPNHPSFKVNNHQRKVKHMSTELQTIPDIMYARSKTVPIPFTTTTTTSHYQNNNNLTGILNESLLPHDYDSTNEDEIHIFHMDD